VVLASPEVKPVAVLSLSPAGNAAIGTDARDQMKTAVLRGRASTLVMASSGDKEAYENASGLKDLPGVSLSLEEGEDHGFAFFKERADLMAVFFGEYLTYHHTGKSYAAGVAKKPATRGNVITDKTVAERKAADAPK
jgi:hypothetical protein